MDKLDKANCPVQNEKSSNKDDNWEIASKFLGMIFGISEEQRKEWTEKAKNDYYTNKNGEK